MSAAEILWARRSEAAAIERLRLSQKSSLHSRGNETTAVAEGSAAGAAR